ncbi:MAG: type II toxin-antitoxin system HicA family toxin [Alphaproteobacteria bacterium]|nr:type II toxin-antitoxin system HicA family toxin [Alphaproteobacteria bacterium]
MVRLLSSREIIAVLNKNDFVFKSQKGSHTKYVKGALTVIVPHPKKEIPYGTFLSIVRQSGMSKEEFFRSDK